MPSGPHDKDAFKRLMHSEIRFSSSDKALDELLVLGCCPILVLESEAS